jgi:membrane protease YdiL (CAAX protease family)
MFSRKVIVPVLFAAAIVPMVALPFLRLRYTDPAAWLFWDYAGRLCTLHVLIAIPALREIAYHPQTRRVPLWEVALWIAGVFVFSRLFYSWGLPTIDRILPGSAWGQYPHLRGSLYWFDIFFGLALVAFSEEIVYRRCVRHILKDWMGDGWPMVFVSALLFGAAHWWSGAGNVVGAILVGILLMLYLRRCGVLWPAVLCHYLINLVSFG